MSRKKLYCIVIDDVDQHDNLKGLVVDLRRENIELNYKFINPLDYSVSNRETGEISFNQRDLFDSIREGIKQGGRMIACDHGLTVLDGYDLIYNLRTDLKYKHDVILYSGNIKTILAQKFNTEDQIGVATGLSKRNIKEWLQRDTYIESLKGYFRHSVFDIKVELLEWLNAFENHRFNRHPKLERKTLGEIAKAIENEEPLGVEFQKLFVEQGISAMIHLNELPPNV